MKRQSDSASRTDMKKQLDWVTTVVPFVCILLLCAAFMV